jgi:hypothetical protein
MSRGHMGLFWLIGSRGSHSHLVKSVPLAQKLAKSVQMSDAKSPRLVGCQQTHVGGPKPQNQAMPLVAKKRDRSSQFGIILDQLAMSRTCDLAFSLNVFNIV